MKKTLSDIKLPGVAPRDKVEMTKKLMALAQRFENDYQELLDRKYELELEAKPSIKELTMGRTTNLSDVRGNALTVEKKSKTRMSSPVQSKEKHGRKTSLNFKSNYASKFKEDEVEDVRRKEGLRLFTGAAKRDTKVIKTYGMPKGSMHNMSTKKMIKINGESGGTGDAKLDTSHELDPAAMVGVSAVKSKSRSFVAAHT